MSRPKPQETWLRYHDESPYRVLFIANENVHNHICGPTVVYEGPDGRRWARPLHDWHRSFTLRESEGGGE